MSLPVIYCKQWKNAKKIANQIGDCFIFCSKLVILLYISNSLLKFKNNFSFSSLFKL